MCGWCLLRLPRGLAGLAEVADAIARYADADVEVFAGGRDKYLTKSMNDLIAQWFSDVRASRGRQKSRTLLVRGPKTGWRAAVSGARTARRSDIDVVAHGAAFSGARVDIGTRFLLEHLKWMKPDAPRRHRSRVRHRILAVALAKVRPGIEVVGTDQSAAAVASARATAEANGVADRVTVVRDGRHVLGRRQQRPIWCCAIRRSTSARPCTTGSAIKMFAEAGRVLRPRWRTVDCLQHPPELSGGCVERMVGQTEVIGRTSKVHSDAVGEWAATTRSGSTSPNCLCKRVAGARLRELGTADTRWTGSWISSKPARSRDGSGPTATATWATTPERHSRCARQAIRFFRNLLGKRAVDTPTLGQG